MLTTRKAATNTGFASGGVTPKLPLVDRGRQCKLGPDNYWDYAFIQGRC